MVSWGVVFAGEGGVMVPSGVFEPAPATLPSCGANVPSSLPSKLSSLNVAS